MAPLIWEKQERVKRMAEFTWYHNGKWLPQSQVKPDPNDRGVTLGDQVVDVERTFGGKGFRIKEHIDRLYKSLKHVRIEIGISPAEMIEITGVPYGAIREIKSYKPIVNDV